MTISFCTVLQFYNEISVALKKERGTYTAGFLHGKEEPISVMPKKYIYVLTRESEFIILYLDPSKNNYPGNLPINILIRLEIPK